MNAGASIKHVFSLRTPNDLLVVLKEDLQELESNPASGRHAIHCALLAWHLSEWAWAMRFKKNSPAQIAIFGEEFRDQKEFLAHVKKKCPALEIMKGVAEGAKHLGTTSRFKRTIEDYGSAIVGSAVVGTMRIGSTGALAVEADGTLPVEFLPAVRQAVRYWEQILTI